MTDQQAMQAALAEARHAEDSGEVPVGAVILHAGELLATGQNRVIRDADPTAHAEIVALRAAGRALANYRLDRCTLFTTLEPCAMCAGAILHARLDRLVYAAPDPKAGACGSALTVLNHPSLNHTVQLEAGLHAAESSALLTNFFRQRRHSTRNRIQPSGETTMSDRLKGKVAIVTGSSSGIGQAIAIRFAQEGANVVIDFRSHPEGANETKAQIEASGAKAITVQADVSRLPDTQNLVDQAWSQLGGCDILVNNAGVEKNAAFLDITESDYDAVLDVNLKGAFFLTQAFVRRLRDAKKPGRVINISSVHEDMVFPNFTTYCCSKGAIRMMMRNLAVELGPIGITVNNIAPGAINTPINASLLADQPKLNALLANIPLGRLGTPAEVSGLAVLLASDDGAYTTGSTYVVDGGLMRNYHEQ